MSDQSQQSRVTGNAQRLLVYLQRFAPRPDIARTDEVISRALEIPERTVIELADELLQAGHMIVASVTFPAGRWLLTEDAPDEYWLKARKYADGLTSRAIQIHARAKHAKSAMEVMEQRRRVRTNGQANLFGPGPSLDGWTHR